MVTLRIAIFCGGMVMLTSYRLPMEVWETQRM
jgi:hypothetical protein